MMNLSKFKLNIYYQRVAGLNPSHGFDLIKIKIDN